ncbi:MAG: hypothetical protein ACHQF3_07915 [Alphaproteobacteria bacterium]
MISVLEGLRSTLAGFGRLHAGGQAQGGRAGVRHFDLGAIRRMKAERRDLQPYLQAASAGGGKLARGTALRHGYCAARGGCEVIRFRKGT